MISSTLRAGRNEERATPKFAASSRSGGSFVPGESNPSLSSCWNRRMSSCVTSSLSLSTCPPSPSGDFRRSFILEYWAMWNLMSTEFRHVQSQHRREQWYYRSNFACKVTISGQNHDSHLIEKDLQARRCRAPKPLKSPWHTSSPPQEDQLKIRLATSSVAYKI